MSRRWFTSDWHLGMQDILRFEERPFKSIEKHDSAILRSAKERAKEDDTIIHIGDFCSFKEDRGNKGLEINPREIIKTIPASFVNIRGNHDINNKVKSLCESMRIHLGKRFLDVSLSHYPSYDNRSKNQFNNGDIHLCGHIHRKWKHCLDLTHSVLNINVGVDVWKYQIVSEEELIQYIEKVLKLPKDDIIKIQIEQGKIKYV